jgi:hypothetical protein
MGLIEKEIKEITELRNRFNAGKVKPEEVMINMALFSQTEKRLKLMLQAMAHGAKYGKKQMQTIIDKNILGDGSTLMITEDSEIENIRCENGGNLIQRQECLDTSGEDNEKCKGCETGIRNKRILLGVK